MPAELTSVATRVLDQHGPCAFAFPQALRGTSTPCGVTDLVDVAFTNANEAGAVRAHTLPALLLRLPALSFPRRSKPRCILAEPPLTPALRGSLQRRCYPSSLPQASKLSSTIIGELLEAGAASGTLRQGVNQWTPAVYQTQQKEGIAAFLSSNGFVTFDMVRCAVSARAHGASADALLSVPVCACIPGSHCALRSRDTRCAGKPA